MGNTYGFNDKKEKVKVWDKVREEIVKIPLHIHIQKKGEDGVYKEYLDCGYVNVPFLFAKCGNNVAISIHFTVAYNTEPGSSFTTFETIDEDGNVYLNILLPYVALEIDNRLLIESSAERGDSHIPDKYGMWSGRKGGLFYNQIDDRGEVMDNLWVRIRKNIILLYTQSSNAGDYAGTFTYFGANTD